jgi:hypothetical protein
LAKWRTVSRQPLKESMQKMPTRVIEGKQGAEGSKERG